MSRPVLRQRRLESPRHQRMPTRAIHTAMKQKEQRQRGELDRIARPGDPPSSTADRPTGQARRERRGDRDDAVVQIRSLIDSRPIQPETHGRTGQRAERQEIAPGKATAPKRQRSDAARSRVAERDHVVETHRADVDGGERRRCQQPSPIQSRPAPGGIPAGESGSARATTARARSRTRRTATLARRDRPARRRQPQRAKESVNEPDRKEQGTRFRPTNSKESTSQE